MTVAGDGYEILRSSLDGQVRVYLVSAYSTLGSSGGLHISRYLVTINQVAEAL